MRAPRGVRATRKSFSFFIFMQNYKRHEHLEAEENCVSVVGVRGSKL